MPKLYVLVGLPGSGKSTYVKNQLLPSLGEKVFIYSTDRYIEEEAASRGQTYSEGFSLYIEDATSVMNHSLDVCVKERRDIIWDQTNLTAKKRAKILNKIPDVYEKNCVLFKLPKTKEQWDELYRRLNSRPGKIISKYVIKSMFDSYKEPSIDEGFNNVEKYEI